MCTRNRFLYHTIPSVIKSFGGERKSEMAIFISLRESSVYEINWSFFYIFFLFFCSLRTYTHIIYLLMLISSRVNTRHEIIIILLSTGNL